MLQTDREFLAVAGELDEISIFHIQEEVLKAFFFHFLQRWPVVVESWSA